MSDIKGILQSYALGLHEIVNAMEDHENTNAKLTKEINDLQEINQSLQKEVTVYKLDYVPSNVCLWKESMKKLETEKKEHEQTSRLLLKAKAEIAALKSELQQFKAGEVDVVKKEESQGADNDILNGPIIESIQTTVSYKSVTIKNQEYLLGSDDVVYEIVEGIAGAPKYVKQNGKYKKFSQG